MTFVSLSDFSEVRRRDQCTGAAHVATMGFRLAGSSPVDGTTLVLIVPGTRIGVHESQGSEVLTEETEFEQLQSVGT